MSRSIGIRTNKVLKQYLIKISVVNTLMFGLFNSTLLLAAEPAWLKPYIAKCDAGHLQDCFNVAVAYKKGGLHKDKVKQDSILSEKYLNRAVVMGKEKCARGGKYECYKMGILYFEGYLVPADFPKGLEYMQKSCRGGYQQACDWMLNSGIPVQ